MVKSDGFVVTFSIFIENSVLIFFLPSPLLLLLFACDHFFSLAFYLCRHASFYSLANVISHRNVPTLLCVAQYIPMHFIANCYKFTTKTIHKWRCEMFFSSFSFGILYFSFWTNPLVRPFSAFSIWHFQMVLCISNAISQMYCCENLNR